jgi:hypothetical protein
MKKKGKKERLKPLSFYGLDPRDVIRAFMQIDPEELKKLEEEDRKSWEAELITEDHRRQTRS